MDMLCIAAQADQTGYLTVNGEALATTDIARMVGGSETEVATLIDELSRNGVLSRTRTGTIYSRRMVRDAKKARTARENGKSGGNPSLGKLKDIPKSDKGSLKAEVKSRGARDLEAEKPDIREAGASRAEAPPADPLKAKVFGPVLDYLVANSGRSEAACRAELGRLRKAHGDGAVIEAAAAAQREGKSDPIAAMEFTLGGMNGRAHHRRQGGRQQVEPDYRADMLAGIGMGAG
jgi:hypothetical protein